MIAGGPIILASAGEPHTVEAYAAFYGLKQDAVHIVLYKAVHKRDGVYRSDNDPDFIYEIGKMAVADGMDWDADDECGAGIHMAPLPWCLKFGRNWRDLAILELEAEKSDLVLPAYTFEGKVRAPKAFVRREVPKNEWS